MRARTLCPQCEARFPVDPADLEEYEIECSSCDHVLTEGEIARHIRFDVDCEKCGEGFVVRLRDVGEKEILCPGCDAVTIPPAATGKPLSATRFGACARIAKEQGASIQAALRMWLDPDQTPAPKRRPAKTRPAARTRAATPKPKSATAPPPPPRKGRPWGLYVLVVLGLLGAGFYALVEAEKERSREYREKREREDKDTRRRAKTLDPRIRESIAGECRMTSISLESFDRCVLDGERQALERRAVERHADEYREGL